MGRMWHFRPCASCICDTGGRQSCICDAREPRSCICDTGGWAPILHLPRCRARAAGRLAAVGASAQNGAVSLVQPVLPLWDEPPLSHRDRVVADSTDRVAWLKARARGVTATDAARLTGRSAIHRLVQEKLHGSGFTGNAFTDHGRRREPEIAAWAARTHQVTPSTALFHAAGNAAHLATPDGIRESPGGRLELCEIKTTSVEWRGIPRSYLRQVWWQQYVLGAERTLVVWERHVDFVPVGEPEARWVDRDEDQIARLVALADELLTAVRR